MGVQFNCEDSSFGCSYSGWHQIRVEIIKATIDYIQDKYTNDKELYGSFSEEDEKYIGEGSSYQFYMKHLLDSKNILFEQNTNVNRFGIEIVDRVNIFNNLCRDFDFMNALNHFDIGGLFALCNQSDCEGYYTPGNSLDICSLFDKIKPFVKKYSVYDDIYENARNFHNKSVYEVFEHSYKTLNKVIIC